MPLALGERSLVRLFELFPFLSTCVEGWRGGLDRWPARWAGGGGAGQRVAAWAARAGVAARVAAWRGPRGCMAPLARVHGAGFSAEISIPSAHTLDFSWIRDFFRFPKSMLFFANFWAVQIQFYKTKKTKKIDQKFYLAARKSLLGCGPPR